MAERRYLHFTTYRGKQRGSESRREPFPGRVMVSDPPPGKCRIINVYWDPETQRAVFEYDDEPVE